MSISPDTTFIFRTPLLQLNNIPSDSTTLLNAFKQDIVRQALYIASRDLYNELVSIEKGEVKEKWKYDKILTGLYKYYTRMCTRCTPFGLFAGLNVGTFAQTTDITFTGKVHARTRLDMDYLCNLFYELNKDVTLYDRLTFYANNSLYRVGEQWRYVEYQFKDTMRFHNLVSINDNELLSALIEKAAKGATLQQLSEAVQSFGFEEDEAIPFLNELISSQVLVSNLYPSVTGEEYQHRLFRALETMENSPYPGLSTQIEAIFKQDSFIEKTAAVTDFLSRFNVDINTNHLLQIDLLKEAATCQIDASIKPRIEAATAALALLKKPFPSETTLDKFVMAFYERYEEKFMPLSHVMDTDIGLGYKNAVKTGTRPKQNQDPLLERKIRTLKMKLYTSAIRNNTTTVTLTDDDLLPFKGITPPPMAPTYNVMGNVVKQDDGQLTIRYKHGGGSSALQLLGRFGHLHTDIGDLCEALSIEENNYFPNALVAEIVHLPHGRLGNILTRTHLKNYEIPYLGYSSLPNEQQITIDDLYVGLVNFRPVLYSKKHQREVIPRLSNAHNFQADSLPVYNFLCDLQKQNNQLLVSWSWDELYDEEWLPRVIYKDLILAPAKWHINTSLFKEIDPEAHHERFSTLLTEKRLPLKFLIIENDNELYIDLASPLGRATFVSACKKNETLTLEEFLFSEERATDGYTNEIVIPFTNKQAVKYTGIENRQVEQQKEDSYSPLSEWIYFKIFTGKKFADKLLLQAIPGLIDQLKQAELISKWFFIRYADPKDHLRLRFLLTDKNKQSLILDMANAYLKQYLDNHTIWNLEIATYRREMERYGQDTIEAGETWFWHNSEMVLSLLPVHRRLNQDDQLLYAIFCVDKLLTQTGCNILQKGIFVKSPLAMFTREFSLENNKSLRQTLNDSFRKTHAQLKSIMNGNPENERTWQEVNTICEKAMYATEDVIYSLKSHYTGDIKFDQIIGSYIHMFTNRLFISNQRYSEMMIYYYLDKYYASEIARQKKVTPQPVIPA